MSDFQKQCQIAQLEREITVIQIRCSILEMVCIIYEMMKLRMPISEIEEKINFVKETLSEFIDFLGEDFVITRGSQVEKELKRYKRIKAQEDAGYFVRTEKRRNRGKNRSH